MKVFEAGEKQVLVVREKGELYAMGAKCTHYGEFLITIFSETLGNNIKFRCSFELRSFLQRKNLLSVAWRLFLWYNR